MPRPDRTLNFTAMLSNFLGQTDSEIDGNIVVD